MTVEQKAKAYDKAIGNMRKFRDALSNHEETDLWVLKKEIVTDIEYYFPELKEEQRGNDETLRKNLIKAFNAVGGRYWGGLEVRKILTWLEKQEREDYNQYKVIIESIAEMCERYSHTMDWKDFYDNVKVKCKDAIEYDKANPEKQGKQKSIIKMKTPEESLGIDSDTYNEIVDACIYDEQKPADKVESKFHEGDWITFYGGTPFKIIKIGREQNGKLDYLLLDTSGHDSYYNKKYVDKNARLWDIKDAKDGDALVSGDVIFIFNKIHGIWVNCHCSLHKDGSFNDDDYDLMHIKYGKEVYPATKEQHDTLFKTMADVGWEFDFGKKKLKKTEQKPVPITDEWIEDYWQHHKVINPYFHDKGEEIQFDHQGFVRFCKKYCKKPTAWSEEDENMYRKLHNLIYAVPYCDSRKEFSEWLKSLKQRMGK